MSARFFVDTNVFVYLFDPRAPEKMAKAEEIIRGAIKTGLGLISYQVVQEFFHVAFRKFPTPMSFAESQQYLTTMFRPLLAVESSPGLFGEGMRIRERYQLSWYDALIVAAAMEGECEILYSEDFQDGQKFGDVVVRNPFK
jgi:predicted nucleic acid-binding protein